MAKPEWGQKRTCNSCNCRFYDMGRSPITCPKCGSTVEHEMPFKVRRGSSAAAEPKPAQPVLVDEADADANDLVAMEDDEPAENEEENADEDESGLIEDASDLGEDDDDMAEVMEHIDEEIEDEV